MRTRLRYQRPFRALALSPRDRVMRLKLRLGLSAFSALSLGAPGGEGGEPVRPSASNGSERSEGPQGKLREPGEGSRRKRHAEAQGKK
jgi:hypothetical protein